ncbi:hypothetical protein IFM89_004785 [Coptis chinensis]|uniref:Uncharacterized protein n=1 Tax=Coptis chinensis TaxID=261450 RepID=A0A835M1J6_9MAGN|nr:hypothetical protein IFM89_004785 [Coptis chinensis]
MGDPKLVLGLKEFVIHYDGGWGKLKASEIRGSDYNGGEKVEIEMDGHEFCLEYLKTNVEKLVGEGVIYLIDCIIDGFICRITHDIHMTHVWDELQPEKDKKYHLYVSQPPTPKTETINPKSIPTTSVPSQNPKSTPTQKTKPVGTQKIKLKPKPVRRSARLNILITKPVLGPNGKPMVLEISNDDKSEEDVHDEVNISEDPILEDVVHEGNSEEDVVMPNSNVIESQLDLIDHDFCTQNIHAYIEELEAHVEDHMVDNTLDNSDVIEDLNVGDGGNDILKNLDVGGDRGSDTEDDQYEYGDRFGPVFGDKKDTDYNSCESDDADYDYIPTDSDCLDNKLDKDIDPIVVDKEVKNLEEGIQGTELGNVVKLNRNIYEVEEMAKVADPVVEEFGTCELEPRMSWATVEVCRDFFKTMAVKHKFSSKQVRNDRLRIELKCKVPDCDWAIIASVTKKDNHTFILRSYNDEHTCQADEKNLNTHARAPWVAKALLERMRDHPDYRRKDIMKEMFSQFGINISYWTAWNARMQMLEAIHGNYENGYKLVPEMCRQIMRRNLGSISKYFMNQDSHNLIGVLVPFNASLDGWRNGCRPIVGLDGCFLKGKHGGCCLTVIGLDAMNGIFPLGIYICKAENKDTWRQFLCEMKSYLDMHKDKLTFMSDRQKGLLASVAEYFPDSNHRYCFRHMYQNFKKTFRGELWENLAWGAVEAYKVQEFTRILGVINKTDSKALDWLDKEPRSCWVRAHFDWTVKYCSPYFSVEAFRQTYSNYLYPLDNIEEWPEIEDPEELVLPPELTRKSGRPRKQRIRGEDEPTKTKRKCKKCGELGHNAITCALRQNGQYGQNSKKRKVQDEATSGHQVPVQQQPPSPKGRATQQQQEQVQEQAATPVQ